MHWSASYLIKCALAPASSSAPYYQAPEFSATNPPQLGQNNLNLMAPKPSSMIGGADDQSQFGVGDVANAAYDVHNMASQFKGPTQVGNVGRGVGQAVNRVAPRAGQVAARGATRSFGSQMGRVAARAAKPGLFGGIAQTGGKLLGKAVGAGGALMSGAAMAETAMNVPWNLVGSPVLRAANERRAREDAKLPAAQKRAPLGGGYADTGHWDYTTPMDALWQ